MHRTMIIAAGVLATLALAFAVAGCGGGDDDGSGTDDAVAEIAEVRTLLGQALDAYRDGDAEAAEERAGDAYLEHFEAVEEPLEERDDELMEELEVLISTTIRDRIKAGAPASEVAELVDEANAKLTEAEAALQSG